MKLHRFLFFFLKNTRKKLKIITLLKYLISDCFMKPICSRSSQHCMKWWCVNSESTRSPQQHTVLVHWLWASHICGFRQMITIMVALKCRVCLPTPRKILNILGKRLETVFALVLWEETKYYTATVDHQEPSPEQKEQDERKEKKNELHQNVRVKFKTQWS